MTRGNQVYCSARCEDGTPHLTAREIDVLLLAATGLSSRQIARVLGISVRTVDDHFGAALHRSSARSRVELIARCGVAGVFAPDRWPPVWSGKRCLCMNEMTERKEASIGLQA